MASSFSSHPHRESPFRTSARPKNASLPTVASPSQTSRGSTGGGQRSVGSPTSRSRGTASPHCNRSPFYGTGTDTIPLFMSSPESLLQAPYTSLFSHPATTSKEISPTSVHWRDKIALAGTTSCTLASLVESFSAKGRVRLFVYHVKKMETI